MTPGGGTITTTPTQHMEPCGIHQEADRGNELKSLSCYVCTIILALARSNIHMWRCHSLNIQDGGLGE